MAAARGVGGKEGGGGSFLAPAAANGTALTSRPPTCGAVNGLGGSPRARGRHGADRPPWRKSGRRTDVFARA